MIYEIHLYAPKRSRLTPAALEWLFENGQRDDQPEAYWPVYRIKPKALARHMMRLDPTLIPYQGPGNDVELHFADERLEIVLYTHDRGMIIFFPYSVYGTYSRIVLGIVYTYIRHCYDRFDFWSYDPQLNIISFADDYQSIEETAILMDQIMPKPLSDGS